MVYGLGRKNAAGKYSPLSIVQLTTDERSVRTAQLNYVPRTLTTDPYKRTIAIFISEVLYHVLRHPMPDETMFDFLALSAQQLGETDEPQNFHIAFLTGFAAQLGFAIPETAEGISPLAAGTPHTREERQHRLQKLCAYYAEHVETWQNPKSLDVLTEVFDS
jgi:DNA repair protein RecO (recombination protein O)